MSKERNVLFGLLAVVLEKVSPDALQRRRDETPDAPDLGRRLVDDGSLSEDDRAAIDSLADLALKAHNGNAVAAVRTLGGSDPQLHSVVATLLSPEGDATRLGEEPDFGGGTAGAVKSIFGQDASQVAFNTMRELDGKACDPDEIVPAVQEHPGRYIELREFAKGGMGKIILVQDTHFGRDVALKQLLSENLGVSTRPGAPSTQLLTVPIIARFLQEARITGQLEHPSIVPVYELGYRDDGSLYYTMKFVRGKNLQDAIVEAKDLRERLLLLPHFLDLCYALSYAHDRGVIHRDIKPLNLMIGEFGETVVIDWGIAKVKGVNDIHEREMAESVRALRLGDAEATAKTTYGQTIGSPYFMPPEQATGRTEEIDERSDTYALGAVLYAILTGHAPYSQMKVREFMEKVVSFDPKPVREVDPEVPPELAAICKRAMARRREDRYQSAKELTEDVQRFIAGGLVSAYEYRFGELLKRFVKKHWKPLATAAAATVAIMVFGVYYNIRVTAERNLAIAAEKAAREAEQVAQDERSAAEAAREVAETERTRAQRELYYANVALAQRSIEEQRMAQARAQLASCPVEFRDWEWGHLEALCNADRMTIRAGGRYVGYALAGDALLCGRDNGTLSVVDAAMGTVRRKLIEKAGYGYVMAVNRAGDRVAVKGDAAVVLFDPASGRELFRFDEPKALDRQHYLGMSRDGRRLGALNSDKTARIWEVNAAGDARELLTLDAPVPKGFGLWISPGGNRVLVQRADFGAEGWVRSFEVFSLPEGTSLGRGEMRDPLTIHAAAFSPDGTTLALGTDEETQVWNVDAWRRTATVPGRVGHPNTVAFDPKGERLAVGTGDGDLTVLTLKTGKQRTVRAAHQDIVRAVAFSPDGKMIATASFDRTARLWSAENARPLATLRRHDKSLFALAFSPEGNALATGSFDGTTRVWDLTAEVEYAPVETLEYHAGRGLLAGTLGGEAAIWDAHTGRRVRDLADSPGRLANLAFNHDGKLLAAIAILPSKKRRAVVWDTDSGARLQNLDAPDGDVRIGFAGAQLALVEGEELRLFEARSGTPGLKAEGVLAHAVSPDGVTLATVGRAEGDGNGRMIVLRDTATGAETGRFEVRTIQEAVPAFNPDGRLLFVGAWQRDGAEDRGKIYVWNVTKGVPEEPMMGHRRQVSCFAFSADGALLATGSTDSTVILWDGKTREKRLEMAGHASNINALAFSPDGARLVTASQDGTFKLWDTENGREILTVQNAAHGAEGQVVTPSFAAFAPNGAELVTLTTPVPLTPRILHALPRNETAYHLEGAKEIGGALETWKRTMQ